MTCGELALWQWLLQHKSIAVNAVFYTALVQNFVLVLRFSDDGIDPAEALGNGESSSAGYTDRMLHRAENLMGVVHGVRAFTPLFIDQGEGHESYVTKRKQTKVAKQKKADKVARRDATDTLVRTLARTGGAAQGLSPAPPMVPPEATRQ